MCLWNILQNHRLLNDLTLFKYNWLLNNPTLLINRWLLYLSGLCFLSSNFVIHRIAVPNILLTVDKACLFSEQVKEWWVFKTNIFNLVIPKRWLKEIRSLINYEISIKKIFLLYVLIRLQLFVDLYIDQKVLFWKLAAVKLNNIKV